MPRYDVYYMRDFASCSIKAYSEAPATRAEVLEERMYSKVIEIDRDHMDDVYMYMQGEVWSPNGEARDLIKSLGLQHTSMSVGDMIHATEEDKLYYVAPVGFELITA